MIGLSKFILRAIVKAKKNHHLIRKSIMTTYILEAKVFPLRLMM